MRSMKAGKAVMFLRAVIYLMSIGFMIEFTAWGTRVSNSRMSQFLAVDEVISLARDWKVTADTVTVEA